MAASKTVVANMALGHLAINTTIANLDTDQSVEAKTVRRFFDQAMDDVFEGHAWRFANAYQALSLVSDADDDTHPTDEWDFCYQRPANCANFIKILSGVRNDSRQSEIKFEEVFSDTQGRQILTDQSNAVGKFTKRITDVSKWPTLFALAVSYRIAMYAAPSLTQGDPFRLGDKAESNFKKTINEAKASDLNQQRPDEEPESEFIRARE